MMKVIVVFKHWNILGFNFTKRDALSSVYKISMVVPPLLALYHTTALVPKFAICIIPLPP
jgi:hypothetical protein